MKKNKKYKNQQKKFVSQSFVQGYKIFIPCILAVRLEVFMVLCSINA